MWVLGVASRASPGIAGLQSVGRVQREGCASSRLLPVCRHTQDVVPGADNKLCGRLNPKAAEHDVRCTYPEPVGSGQGICQWLQLHARPSARHHS